MSELEPPVDPEPTPPAQVIPIGRHALQQARSERSVSMDHHPASGHESLGETLERLGITAEERGGEPTLRIETDD